MAAGLIAAPFPALMQTAAAQTAPPAAPKKKQVKTKKPPTPGQLAAHERLKKCAAEWKKAKAAGKIEKGMKWPKYWSACKKRFKSAGRAARYRASYKNLGDPNAPRASARLEVSPTPSVVIGTGAPRSNCIALVTP
jgi:hypothetical protein